MSLKKLNDKKAAEKYWPLVLMLKFFSIFIHFLGFVDLGINSLFFKLFPRKYMRQGKCKQCGSCCYRLAIEFQPKTFLKIQPILWILIRWHVLINDFTYLGLDINNGLLFFKCNKISNDNKCSIHSFRYAMCRAYPKSFWFKHPATLPGCGYYFINRKEYNKGRFSKFLEKELNNFLR